MKRWPVILAVFFGLSLTLAALHSCRKPQTPKLIVRLVGVTNDLMGTSFAVFTLAGPGLGWLYVADPVIELRHQPLIDGAGWFYRTRLSPGGRARTVKVVMPKTQDEWRVVFRFCSSGLRQRVRELAARVSGVQMRSQTIEFSEAHSDWMEPTSEVDWLGSDWAKP